ncbi:MAG: signal peptidase I [Dysgonamonadaceae bacterium]|jgi:signal peptidase I|nr:signal peptidase I [Dysgonamonadaceae bacterium]
MRKATKKQWIFFAVVALLYILFVVWDGNYWLLLGLPVIFDIYISKFISWGGWKNTKNSTLRKVAEWVDAIVFALVAVYFINIFIFQNYKIPSSSLEKTLLVGDYLFVSKLSYGPRVPNTPLSFPLTQHTLPIVNTKSYIEWPKWDYKRLKGFGNVKRNDIVVFNFPAGDTVARKMENPDYYYLVKRNGRENVNTNQSIYGEIIYRPVDRRENYVKRCVGMPGDNFQIINNDIYIDGKKQEQPKKVQFNYFVETNGELWNEKTLRMLDIRLGDFSVWSDPQTLEAIGIQRNEYGQFNPVYLTPLTQEALQKLQKGKMCRSIHIESEELMKKINAFWSMDDNYPYDADLGWSRDNYGPLWIPKKGSTISLDEKNLALYSHCIVNYEGNTLQKNGNQVLINGKAADNYTFKYDYYFMMGDNRHNSRDSRSWGFVPEDHVVGKPILIWMSLDDDRGWFNGKIRWKRIFRTVSAD